MTKESVQANFTSTAALNRRASAPAAPAQRKMPRPTAPAHSRHDFARLALTVQRVTGEQAAPVQAKADSSASIQRESADEEELQRKADPASPMQRAAEDEEELQMKAGSSAAMQREAPDEEELQRKAHTSAPVQRTGENAQAGANQTGLPNKLKAGVENLSGISLDDVNVHYNSSQPKEVGALAYAQGTDIHVASGQEKHLPHEAWHVVQQKQGRVQPTFQMKTGVGINDDQSLETEADVMGARAEQHSDASSVRPLQRRAANQPPVQRLMSAATFKTQTDADHFYSDSSLNAIYELMTIYETRLDPPASKSDQDFLVMVLGEVKNAGDLWISKNQDKPGKKTQRHIFVEHVSNQAVKDKIRLAALDFSQMPDIKVNDAPKQQPEKEGSKPPKDKKPTKSEKKARQVESAMMQGNIDSCLTRISPVIDAVVPNKGSGANLKLGLDVPVSHGASIGFEVTASAERGDDGVTVGLELLCTGGGNVGLAKLKGKLGGYMEAQAGTSADAMRLISYGIYRSFRESYLVPREVVSAMWGGDSSDLGYKMAEQWAAGVEKDIFGADENACVATGGKAALEAEGGIESSLGSAKVSGEASFSVGRKYNSDSIEKRKLGGKKSLSDSSVTAQDLVKAPPSKRGTQDSVGTRIIALSLSGEVDAALLGGEIGLTMEWERDIKNAQGKKPYRLTGVTIELSGKGTVPLTEIGPGGQILITLNKLLAQSAAKTKSLQGEASRQARDQAETTGSELESMQDISTALATAPVSSSDWEPALEAPEDPEGLQMNGSVSIQAGGSFAHSEKGWENEVSISLITSKGVESPFFTAVLEKTTVIFKKEW